jgi:hypothetical protein
MSSRCSKTDAGRAEIKARALPLSRTARNLLLIIDSSRPVNEWLALVHGATEADLQHLLDDGLIEPAAGAATAAAAPVAPPRPSREPSAASMNEAIASLSYDQLYTLLTTQAKERFGLIKGYRMVLEVEKCANLQELQALAQKFLIQIKDEHGEAGLHHVRVALGIAG